MEEALQRAAPSECDRRSVCLHPTVIRNGALRPCIAKYAVFCFLRYQQVKICIKAKLRVMRSWYTDEHAGCFHCMLSLREKHKMKLALTPFTLLPTE
jgi:hypothetical protein